MRQCLLLSVVLLVLAVLPAMAAKRVALVIGNNDYKALGKLNNAEKDARDMARKLKSLGFDVILKINATRRDMGRAIRAYETKASSSDVGLVFYAGHGIQADGKNYLIPSDADIEIEDDLAYEGVAAKDFFQSMERAGTRVNIMILDACRDNPLPRRTRSAARGLSVVGIPKGAKGTAILYSAGEGQTAQDGPAGGNGIFTAALLKVMDIPNLTLEQTIKQVVRRVKEKTNARQRPWSLTSLEGDFYFSKRGVSPGLASKAAPTTAPRTSSRAQPSVDKETVFWTSIKDSTDPDMFEEYLNQYPNGRFAGLARLKAKKLKAAKVAAIHPPTSRPAATPDRLSSIALPGGNCGRIELKCNSRMVNSLSDLTNRVKVGILGEGRWPIDNPSCAVRTPEAVLKFIEDKFGSGGMIIDSDLALPGIGPARALERGLKLGVWDCNAYVHSR